MKNLTITKITAIVLLLTLVALSMISGTYSKYTTSKEGKSTAGVAKWDIKVGETALEDIRTINLFESVFDLDKVTDQDDLSSVTAGVAEDDINTTTTTKLVAPGTWGKVEIKVTNDSDVPANISAKISNATITRAENLSLSELPIEISTDGKSWTAISDIVGKDVIGTTSEGKTTPVKVDMNKDSTVNVYWRWLYNNSTIANKTDTTDTDIAIKAKAEDGVKCELTFAITATQAEQKIDNPGQN